MLMIKSEVGEDHFFYHPFLAGGKEKHKEKSYYQKMAEDGGS